MSAPKPASHQVDDNWTGWEETLRDVSSLLGQLKCPCYTKIVGFAGIEMTVVAGHPALHTREEFVLPNNRAEDWVPRWEEIVNRLKRFRNNPQLLYALWEIIRHQDGRMRTYVYCMPVILKQL